MYTGYNISKINDNKVIEYLRSCQTKFNYEANSIKCIGYICFFVSAK